MDINAQYVVFGSGCYLSVPVADKLTRLGMSLHHDSQPQQAFVGARSLSWSSPQQRNCWISQRLGLGFGQNPFFMWGSFLSPIPDGNSICEVESSTNPMQTEAR